MKTLWEQAETLRERCYCYLTSYPEGYWRQLGLPAEASLHDRLVASKRDPERNALLSKIQIALPASPGLTLHPALQDLANIVGEEANDAFFAAYYPRLEDVDFPKTKVDPLMQALQREMDREGARRRHAPVRFMDLPWERKCALAERRRYWFGQYGITPRNWKDGTWSLWRVKDVAMPADVKAKFH